MLMMPKMLRHVARNEKRRTALRLSQQQRTRCPCFACLLMPRSVERRGVGSTMVVIICELWGCDDEMMMMMRVCRVAVSSVLYRYEHPETLRRLGLPKITMRIPLLSSFLFLLGIWVRILTIDWHAEMRNALGVSVMRLYIVSTVLIEIGLHKNIKLKIPM